MKRKWMIPVGCTILLLIFIGQITTGAIVPDQSSIFDQAVNVEETGWVEFNEAGEGVLTLETEGDGKYLRYILAQEPRSWVTPTLNIYEFIGQMQPDDYDLTIRFDLRVVSRDDLTVPASYEIFALIRGMSDADLNSFILPQQGGNRYTPLVSYAVASEPGEWTTCEFDLFVEQGDFRDSQEEIFWNFCLFSNWDPAAKEIHLDNFQIIDHNAPEIPSGDESSDSQEASDPGTGDSSMSEPEKPAGGIPGGWLTITGAVLAVVVVAAVAGIIFKSYKGRK